MAMDRAISSKVYEKVMCILGRPPRKGLTRIGNPRVSKFKHNKAMVRDMKLNKIAKIRAIK